ncbi:MAG: hypothetical protein V6Z82_04150 [Flavobacteriales bacterium]
MQIANRDEQTTYKAARFFGRSATRRPDPFWFVAYPGPLFQGVAQYDWQTGLRQQQVYYMDAAHRIPLAKALWDYDFEKRQVVKTWYWATDYADAWEVGDPISIRYSPAAFESLLQGGRQQILNYLMVQARQAYGRESDKTIALFYSRYQRALRSWKQTGMAAPLHRALDADAAQREPIEGREGIQKGEIKQSEAAALSALLNRPLSCAGIPAALKGKKVIDYIEYYVKWYRGCERNYIYTAAEKKPRYLGEIYVHPDTDYRGVSTD